MKNIANTTIHQNLQTLNQLFLSSKSIKKSSFYSKLAILELCGWIEETMDKIVRSCRARSLKNDQNREYIESSVIKRTHGFNYAENFRWMLIQVVGLSGVEIVERSVDEATLQVLRSTLGSLKKSRDEYAHTHLRGITRRLDAPSVTIGKFDRISECLTKLEAMLKKKGL